MGNLSVIPFTELVERLQRDLLRDNTADEGKYKSLINDIYTDWLPSKVDWRILQTSSYITLSEPYSTGTISATNGSQNITGSGTTWTASMTGWKIKIEGDDNIYTFTRTGNTSGTLDKPFLGTTGTSLTYTLFQDTYSLASDFERLLPYGKNRGLYYFDNGQRYYLEPRREDEFFKYKAVTPDTPLYYWIDAKNNKVVFDPPPNEEMYVYYEYIPRLTRLTEYTTGTVSVTSGSATVTGSGTAFSSFVSAGDYFRIDDDGTGSSSYWYQIDSVDSDTQLTLTSNYLGNSGSSLSYTISKVPLLSPPLHLAILYGAAIVGAADQESGMVKTWIALFDEITGAYAGNEKAERKGAQRIKTIWEKPGVFR